MKHSRRHGIYTSTLNERHWRHLFKDITQRPPQLHILDSQDVAETNNKIVEKACEASMLDDISVIHLAVSYMHQK